MPEVLRADPERAKRVDVVRERRQDEVEQRGAARPREPRSRSGRRAASRPAGSPRASRRRGRSGSAGRRRRARTTRTCSSTSASPSRSTSCSRAQACCRGAASTTTSCAATPTFARLCEYASAVAKCVSISARHCSSYDASASPGSTGSGCRGRRRRRCRRSGPASLRGAGRTRPPPRAHRRPRPSRDHLAGFGPLQQRGISAIRSGFAPSTVFVPSSSVTRRSVESRSVKQRTPSAVVSSCTPPESVRTKAASASSQRNSR